MMINNSADLTELRNELKRWDAEGRRPRLWIRDDDMTLASERFLAMSQVLKTYRLRALLSIIPALMQKNIGTVLDAYPLYDPCQHGLAHKNHEPADQPKAEFGSARATDASINDIATGRKLLTTAFGDRLVPIFVPPWNRIAPEVCAALPGLGFKGLSSYVGQDVRQPQERLSVVNSDIDILNWEEPHDGGVSVLPLPVLAGRLAATLRARREEDDHTPIGILTHHRAMNAEAWQVVSAVVEETLASDIVEWPAPGALFGYAESKMSP